MIHQITKLTRTCLACPSQWEGNLADGRFIYIRYRYAHLTYGLGNTLDEAITNDRCAIEVGNHLDGYMQMEEMLEHLMGFVLTENAEVSNYEDWWKNGDD